MKENLANMITNKIENCINKQYKGDINAFKIEYPNLQKFIPKFNLDIIMTHSGLKIINDDDYNNIIENLALQYNTNTRIDLIKVLNNKKVTNFVDTLILALIVGAIITFVLLNIYSKIIQNF